MLAVIGVGIVVFATTNIIDDILLLSAFFANPALRPRAVVVGQFAGIGVRTVASTAAALLALTIPDGWIGLLGLALLRLGLRGHHTMWRSRGGDPEDGERLRTAERPTRSEPRTCSGSPWHW